ncbi:MAG: zinc ribbon domain-containing protein [Spartobacteria bacterium]
MSKLICPDCQHENEAERIYCHNCGARLDRTGLAKENPAAADPTAETQKHLKKLFKPGRGNGKLVAVKLFKIILGALVVAALIVMILPANLPPVQKSYAFAPMINMDLVQAVSSRQATPLVYNEEQVNSYITSNLRRKDSPSHEGFFPLRRILVQFQEGQCTINTVRELFGYPIYGGASYRVSIDHGKLASVPTSGYIGRMPIHPKLVKVTDLFLKKAWASLDREQKSVSRLAGIEFHPQSVTLIPPR